MFTLGGLAGMMRGQATLGIVAFLALLAVFAPMAILALGVPPPDEIDSASLSPMFGEPTGPGAGHVLGVDWLGRDVLSRTVFGLRSTLQVVAIAVGFSVLLGTAMGLVAGYRGGPIDWLISRSIELFLVLPYVALAAGIASSCSRAEGCVGGAVRPGFLLTGLVIGLATWPFVARVVRERTRQLASADFVDSARVHGAGETRILTTEILPNLIGPLSTIVVIITPQVILAEAGLTFLGIGLPGDVPSWGAMIASGAPAFPEAWWVLVFPGLALLSVVFFLAVLVERNRRVPRVGGGVRS